jgi:hypothetical protein
MVAVALAMLVAGTASGAPEKDCDDPRWENHPACASNTPCMTVTSLDGRSGGIYCDWTPVYDASALTARVGVEVTSGEVVRVVIFVRDSDPGDVCALEQWDRPATDSFEAFFDLVVGDETYWDASTHWCSHLDEIAGTRSDLNGDPLHVQVNYRGTKDSSVRITLKPEQAG